MLYSSSWANIARRPAGRRAGSRHFWLTSVPAEMPPRKPAHWPRCETACRSTLLIHCGQKIADHFLDPRRPFSDNIQRLQASACDRGHGTVCVSAIKSAQVFAILSAQEWPQFAKSTPRRHAAPPWKAGQSRAAVTFDFLNVIC